MLMNRLRSRLLVFGSTLLTLLLIAGLWADWPSWIRGTVWMWDRRNISAEPLRVFLLLLLITIWCILLLWIQNRRGNWQRWQTGLLVIALMIFTPLLQVAVEAQHLANPLAGPFMETTMVTTGFFHEGVQISDPSQFIRNHPDQMVSYRGVHMQTQPPGWPVAFWATTQFYEQFPQLADTVGHQLLRYDCASPEINQYSLPQIASATLLMIVTYVSGIGGVLLYFLGKRLFSVEIGRFAALLFPLWPGVLTFKSNVDVLYALIALAALLLTWHAQHSNGALAGLCVLLVGTTWVSFGIGATVIWVGLFAAVQVALWNRNWTGLQRLLVIGLSLGGTFLAFWSIVYLIWRVSWWEMFQNSIAIHHGMRASSPLWGIYNYYELALFVGLPMLILAIVGAGQAVLRLLRGRSERGDDWLLTWLLFVIVLNALGQVQAETGRIWLFVMPATLLAAVATLERAVSTTKNRRWIIVFTFAAQAFTVGFLLGGQAVEPRTPSIVRDFDDALAAQNGELIETDFVLGDSVELEGLIVATVAEGRAITLLWRVKERVSADLTTFVHIFDATGNIVAQSDSTPANGQLPTWCWVKGELVSDTHLLPAEEGIVRIGLYEWQTGQRLIVSPPVPNNAIPVPLP